MVGKTKSDGSQLALASDNARGLGGNGPSKAAGDVSSSSASDADALTFSSIKRSPWVKAPEKEHSLHANDSLAERDNQDPI
jgi:hypothetical protein